MSVHSFLAFVCVLGLAGTAAAQAGEAPPPPPGYDSPQPAPPPPPAAQPPPPAAQPPATPAEPGVSPRAENSIYVEGLGAGLYYSFNYERLVIPDLAVRVGFSYMSFGATATAGGSTSSASATYLTFPITASYLGIGSDKHILELGGGVAINYTTAAASAGVSSASGSGVTPFGVLFVGYRIHPIDGAGFNFRVGGMALIAQGLSLSDPDPEALGVLPWFYISMGASF